MIRRPGVFILVLGLLLGASFASAQDVSVPVPGEAHSFGDPRPITGQVAQPAPPPGDPPPASGNTVPQKLDARAVAVYSVLWILAIVLAMTAILRAEATDRYHDHTQGDIKA